MLLQNDALELQYRTSYVRILDSKRKFVEAAQRYYEISQMQNQQVCTTTRAGVLQCLANCMNLPALHCLSWILDKLLR